MTGFLKIMFALVIFTFTLSCGRPGSDSAKSEDLPEIFPDYCEAVVPVNIAPLNFRMDDGQERIFAVISGKENKIIVKGRNSVRIPLRRWRKLLDENAGGSLKVSVFSGTGGEWTEYKPFSIQIKSEPVDPWLVYRLIAPGYEAWSEMGIFQRNVTSFREERIIDNRIVPGGCMNCHSFNMNDPARMLFHLRGDIPGTILAKDGEIGKLNTKTEETISNCVYPFWHPSGKYIGFSVNNISQLFHSVKEKRIEVIDSNSDIVVYDVNNNKLLTSSLISRDSSFETFPVFTPDGKTLVFCSAKKRAIPEEYNKVSYSLCKISFDASSATFGKSIDTLISSASGGKSISFPRVSPDGRFLVFTLSSYGNFSIWHREADLYRYDMVTGNYEPIRIINSSETESYHSWSSCSRWMVFSSRRIDGLYTRLFISYVDTEGNFSKPFLLPQKDPGYYDSELRSFNVPEFVRGRVDYNGRSMIKAIESSGKNVTFELKD